VPTIEVGIHPDPLVVASALGHMADEVETDMGPMASSLAALMGSFERSFAEEGPGWAPWSESYAKSAGRRSHGPLPGQTEILTRTDDLRASMSDPLNYLVEFDKIEFTGEAMPGYGDFHLTGTFKMPQRFFLNIDDDAKEEIQQAWLDWLDRIIEDGVAAVEAFGGGLFSGSFIGVRGAGGRFIA